MRRLCFIVIFLSFSFLATAKESLYWSNDLTFGFQAPLINNNVSIKNGDGKVNTVGVEIVFLLHSIAQNNFTVSTRLGIGYAQNDAYKAEGVLRGFNIDDNVGLGYALRAGKFTFIPSVFLGVNLTYLKGECEGEAKKVRQKYSLEMLYTTLNIGIEAFFSFLFNEKAGLCFSLAGSMNIVGLGNVEVKLTDGKHSNTIGVEPLTFNFIPYLAFIYHIE